MKDVGSTSPDARSHPTCLHGLAASTSPKPAHHQCMQIKELASPARIYTQLIDLMERLAQMGLVHCDFNEFNILVRVWGP